jgi:rhodanese-related sulfurtransferase
VAARWLDRLLSYVLPSPPVVEEGEDVVFVDVRTPQEYARGHVAGAKLIPHTQLASRWSELKRERGKRLLIYCRSGSRSRIATRVLRSKGFERVENAGGIGGLRRAGLEMEKGAA